MIVYILALFVAGISCQVKLNPPVPGLRHQLKDEIRDICNHGIDRYKHWDDGTLVPFHAVENLHYLVEDNMYDAFDKDMDLWYKMDNYSRYFTDMPEYRGPPKNFDDCLDLCPSDVTLIGGIYMHDVEYEGDRSLCIIPFPEFQNVFYRTCSNFTNLHVPRTQDFQNRFECVPDGFIDRKIVVYCPQAPMSQCREANVKLPMACSPKLAKCLPTLSARRKSLMRQKQTNQQNAISGLLGKRLKGNRAGLGKLGPRVRPPPPS